MNLYHKSYEVNYMKIMFLHISDEADGMKYSMVGRSSDVS